MSKKHVQNVTALSVPLPDRILEPAETADVEATNEVEILIGAGTLVEIKHDKKGGAE